MRQEIELRNFTPLPLFTDVRSLQFVFSHIPYAYVYKENNRTSNELSNEGINLEQGVWFVLENNHGFAFDYTHEP
jgi:hypothetical protein